MRRLDRSSWNRESRGRKKKTMRIKDKNVEIIRQTFMTVSQHFLQHGNSLKSLEIIVNPRNNDNSTKRELSCSKKIVSIIFLLSIFSSMIIVKLSTTAIKYAYGNRCLLPNNYLVWEFTRPVSNCDYCRDVRSAIVLPNSTTREDFERWAYSSRPIVVKNAASHWPASRVFDFKFFRKLYETVDGAYDTVDEECQFLHFKSNFARLRDVFEMTDDRAANRAGEDTWYVGWKNCHPQILETMMKFYDYPKFLPDDAEIPRTNYVFLGYDEGAIMHLDYIPRLMWQGQIVGSKTWTVAPTPECENVCEGFDFSVGNGDVVMIDTRLWYHGTFVDNGLIYLGVIWTPLCQLRVNHSILKRSKVNYHSCFFVNPNCLHDGKNFLTDDCANCPDDCASPIFTSLNHEEPTKKLVHSRMIDGSRFHGKSHQYNNFFYVSENLVSIIREK